MRVDLYVPDVLMARWRRAFPQADLERFLHEGMRQELAAKIEADQARAESRATMHALYERAAKLVDRGRA